MNENIAKRFTEYRKAAGLSQGAVAEKLGVSRQAVSKWERGDAVPDVDNFVALAELYNVSFNTLYFGYEAEAPVVAPVVAPVEEHVAEETLEEVLDSAEVAELAEESAAEEAVETEATEECTETEEETADGVKEKAKKTVKKIVKKIKTVKTTTEDNTALANALTDLPAAALAVTALAASVKAKNKLPLVVFAAAIVPAWHAISSVIKNNKDTAECRELCDDNDSFITEDSVEDLVADIESADAE
jgi:transcriptional regulator with XRE-family HTH domain